MIYMQLRYVGRRKIECLIPVEKPWFSSESHNEGERGKKNIFNGKTYQKFMYPSGIFHLDNLRRWGLIIME